MSRFAIKLFCLTFLSIISSIYAKKSDKIHDISVPTKNAKKTDKIHRTSAHIKNAKNTDKIHSTSAHTKNAKKTDKIHRTSAHTKNTEKTDKIHGTSDHTKNNERTDKIFDTYIPTDYAKKTDKIYSTSVHIEYAERNDKIFDTYIPTEYAKKTDMNHGTSIPTDFFTSMGWYKTSNQSYLHHKFLDETIYAQTRFKQLLQVKGLYERNISIGTDSSRESVLPKIIHQIWIGPKTPPEIFKKSRKSIKRLHPNWEYRLWTDADLPEFQLENQKYYDLENNFGAKADILRYEILNRYGGIYLDVDFVCLKPLDWLCRYDFWGVIQPIDCHTLICNGAFGCIPGHPILEDCIRSLGHSWNSHERKDILNTTGPMHFQRSVMKFIDDEKMNILMLPSGFFFPIIFNDRLLGLKTYIKESNRSKKGLKYSKKKLALLKAKSWHSKKEAEKTIKSFLRPETHAVHYWAGSWW